ncbi:MAG TPA: hypothetical protein VFO52_11650 [Longimicrobiales bacterium]|nr:hypothetical protein [Longimicrobiales bacterium]
MIETLRVDVVVWMLTVLLVVAVRLRLHQRSSGLVLAYMANLWLIHWPAALTYLFPLTAGREADRVIIGFHYSTLGIMGFAAGAILIAPFLVRVLEPPRSHTRDAERRLPDARLPLTYVLIGISSYLVLTPLLGRIPTVSAMVGATTQLIIAGFCLGLWYFWYAGQRRKFLLLLLLAFALPMATILRQGFLGYGAVALITIVTFIAVFYRPRWKLVLMSAAVAYLGFSFYVTYMRDRGELRESVWGGQSAIERVARLSRTLTGIEWFDPTNPQHILRITGRLNQNYLVGAAAGRMESGTNDFANGETVWHAVLSLIPRAIWPEKPVRAGSPDIVTKYTGINFARGTSVGIGQVMEFYVNFGAIGVILGFLILGAVLTMIDTWAGMRLWAGDWLQFAVWYLTGLAMIQAGGSLIEVVSSAGAALLAVLFVNRYVVRLRLGPPRTVVQESA